MSVKQDCSFKKEKTVALRLFSSRCLLTDNRWMMMMMNDKCMDECNEHMDG